MSRPVFFAAIALAALPLPRRWRPSGIQCRGCGRVLAARLWPVLTHDCAQRKAPR